MRLENITLFERDINLKYQEALSTAKTKLSSSAIQHDTSDKDLEEIESAIINSIWNFNDTFLSDEPTDKNSIEVNLSFSEAMAVLNQASTGSNPATFVTYEYAVNGYGESLRYSNGGYNKYTLIGEIDHNFRSIKIILAIPGLVGEHNIKNVKQQRDYVLNRIKSVLIDNNSTLATLKADLIIFVKQETEKIREQKRRTHKTNSLL